MGNANAKVSICGVPVIRLDREGIRSYCQRRYVVGDGRKGCCYHDRGQRAMAKEDLAIQLFEDGEGNVQGRNTRVTTFADPHIGGRGVKSLVHFKEGDFITTHGLRSYTKGKWGILSCNVCFV